MSVFTMMTVPADPRRVQQVMEANEDSWQALNARAKEHGALHHRFLASGDGATIAVFDEWESAEAFQAFFEASPEIPRLMGEAGVTSEPQFMVWQPLDTPDAF
jgi:heme-degrading monooxygenase HmoA